MNYMTGKKSFLKLSNKRHIHTSHKYGRRKNKFYKQKENKTLNNTASKYSKPPKIPKLHSKHTKMYKRSYRAEKIRKRKERKNNSSRDKKSEKRT